MKRLCTLFLTLTLISLGINAQTDYTSSIVNPSFETGNSTGWTWSGTTGFTWVGVNTDGDATKTGSYIAGCWNSTIGDVSLLQTITGLPVGMYQVTADLMGSSNSTTSRLTTQRLFANGVSELFGSDSAYSADNQAILSMLESYSFAGYSETQSDQGPFKKMMVISPVTNGTLTIGIKTNGKDNSLGFTFPNLTAGDGYGWFKVDNFTLTRIGDLTAAIKSNASLRNIEISNGTLSPAFIPDSTNYQVTLSAGTASVKPTVITEVPGVTVSGDSTIDVSSGSGVSTITVTSVDNSNTKTYTINYTVIKPAPLTGEQQERLYPNEFPLKDVTLLDGPFKHARDLNIQTLLQYDVNRLLAPYRKVAGLPAIAQSYSNWIGLDGHIAGHYLSALSMNYAATGDTACERLMNYMVSQLKLCQDTNATTNASWGVGYCGGVPNSAAVWSELKNGDFTAYNSAWVPWYNVHKMYAGLRDAWLYGGNDTAKAMFLKFCDWGIYITSNLSDAQMQTMLNTEHGGMNEMFADAYQMTGNTKYLTAAKRFSHKVLLNSMAISVDNLDNMHANTQIPKAIGFERISEVSKDPTYTHAAKFFWQTVTENRCLASGGTGRQEYFPAASACMDYINDVEGPETCPTYNMLKLTEDLFRDNPSAKYADYYERALYDHILSTQNPVTGGYVYFTPARPRHYRVYSAPGKAMWCCVGTGMENHSKYNEFIYTHRNDSLYLNLFIASTLNWTDKGVKVRQETTFPNEAQTKLIVSDDSPTAFTLMVRSPKWVAAGALKIIVNTDTLNIQSVPETYIPVSRTWNNGDSVKILLPMHTSVEQMPNVPSYVAIMHGPILLGAETGTQDQTGMIADDSRWGHIPSGPILPLDQAPMLVGNRDSIPEKIVPVKGEPMKFKAENLIMPDSDSTLVLEPFYKIYDARYMMYWMSLTKNQYQNVLDSLAAAQQAALELQERTIDQVSPGQQQPEVDHQMESTNSSTGTYQNEFWRDSYGGYISYKMLTDEKSDLSLMVRYWGDEVLSRSFYIYIDKQLLTTENIVGKWNLSQFEDVEYPIPNSMTSGKDTITVKFQAINSTNYAGGLFDVRILQPLKASAVESVQDNSNQIKAYGYNDQIIVQGLPENAIVSVYDINGQLISKEKTSQDFIILPGFLKGLKFVKVQVNGKVQTIKVMI